MRAAIVFLLAVGAVQASYQPDAEDYSPDSVSTTTTMTSTTTMTMTVTSCDSDVPDCPYHQNPPTSTYESSAEPTSESSEYYPLPNATIPEKPSKPPVIQTSFETAQPTTTKAASPSQFTGGAAGTFVQTGLLAGVVVLGMIGLNY